MRLTSFAAAVLAAGLIVGCNSGPTGNPTPTPVPTPTGALSLSATVQGNTVTLVVTGDLCGWGKTSLTPWLDCSPVSNAGWFEMGCDTSTSFGTSVIATKPITPGCQACIGTTKTAPVACAVVKGG